MSRTIKCTTVDEMRTALQEAIAAENLPDNEQVFVIPTNSAFLDICDRITRPPAKDGRPYFWVAFGSTLFGGLVAHLTRTLFS